MSTARVLCALTLCARVAGAQASGPCPSEAEDVRLSALSGIMQYETSELLPVLQKILARRDDCSAALRRQVVNLLSRSRDSSRTELVFTVARTDPNREVRATALQALERVNGDRSAAFLDSVLLRSTDADMQEIAARALAQNTSSNARTSLRHAAESTTLPLDIRVRALTELGNGRRSADDAPWLRDFFNRNSRPELREAAMRGASSQHVPETTSWLLGIARDSRQELEVRRSALRLLSQTLSSPSGLRSVYGGMELKDLLALYDEFKGQPDLQVQLLDVYGNRSEAGATEKLLLVARDDPSVELRRRAIQRLGQRRDPRVQQFLLDLINK